MCAWQEASGAPLPAPPGLLPSLQVQTPLPSTYLTSRGTADSGAFAVSSWEDVDPRQALSKMTITAVVQGRAVSEFSPVLFLLPFSF